MQPTTSAGSSTIIADTRSENQTSFSFSKKYCAQQTKPATPPKSTPDIIPLTNEDRKVIAEMKDMFWPKTGFRLAFDPLIPSATLERETLPRTIVLLPASISFKKEGEKLRNEPQPPINYLKIVVCAVVMVAARIWNFFFA